MLSLSSFNRSTGLPFGLLKQLKRTISIPVLGAQLCFSFIRWFNQYGRRGTATEMQEADMRVEGNTLLVNRIGLITVGHCGNDDGCKFLFHRDRHGSGAER